MVTRVPPLAATPSDPASVLGTTARDDGPPRQNVTALAPDAPEPLLDGAHVRHVRLDEPSGPSPRATRSLAVSADAARAFYASMRLRVRGEVGNAAPSAGWYDLREGGTTAPVQLMRLPPEALRQVPIGDLELAYSMRDADGAVRGLFLQARGRGYLVRAELPIPLGDEARSAIADLYRRTRAAIDDGAPLAGATVTQATTSPSGTRITSDGATLEYDGVATIAAYMRNTDHVGGVTTRLDEHDVRIPPRMYELLQDPAFLEARNDRRYSAMVDMIFRKAMALTGGDVEQALFIGLLTTDLRERGPGGAVHGVRGNHLVPPSIYDNETFAASPIGSRLDAAKHFFGYALFALTEGDGPASAYSRFSKIEFRNQFLRRLRDTAHVGRDPDWGDARYGGEGMGAMRLGQDLRLRAEFDRQSDLHYNRLGVAFGTALRADPRAQPSATINDPQYASNLAAIGVPLERSRPWSADPPDSRFRGVFHQAYSQGDTFAVDLDITSTREQTPTERMNELVTIPRSHLHKLELTPVIDGVPRADLVVDPMRPSLRLRDTEETRRFLAGNEQRYIVNHRGRRYVLVAQSQALLRAPNP